jgi:hypothetical protein
MQLIAGLMQLAGSQFESTKLSVNSNLPWSGAAAEAAPGSASSAIVETASSGHQKGQSGQPDCSAV